MTRNLSGLLVAATLLVAGCGGSAPDATDPSGHPSGGPHGVATRVVVVSQTMSGPHREQSATAVSTPQSLASYAAKMGALGSKVRSAVTSLKPAAGQTVYAQVVYVGCKAAPAGSVTAARKGGGIVLATDFTEKPQTECYAPVATLALAVVPG